MATYEAVAAVGLTLQSLLADRARHPNGNGAPLPVTLGHPGPERDPAGAAEDARVNLFLYQVVENHFLQNQEIPGRGHPGTFGQPPLSLNLHFLVTGYGSRANGEFFDETPAHQVLGSVMQVLHDHAVITDSLLTLRQPAGLPVLNAALRGEHEHIKLTLRPLGLEDLSNVWTSLELAYRLSVAYEISVVQVESDRPRSYPQPVLEPPLAGPRVLTVPLQRPQVDSIAVRRTGDPPGSERSAAIARIGDTLIVHGSRLGAGGLVVRMGGLDVPPSFVAPTGDRLEAAVPDDVLPDLTPIDPADRLQPGAQPVSVAAVVPDLPQAAVESGQAAFVLVPSATGASIAGRTLTVTGTRLMNGDEPAQIIVGGTVTEGAGYLPTSMPTSVEVPLADTTPAFPAAALVAGDRPRFPNLPAARDLQVTVGTDGPHVVTVATTPTSFAEAAAAVQEAINASAAAPSFAAVRVAATERGLILVPGDLTSAIVVGNGALANRLRLSSASSARQVYLSGALDDFPTLTSAAPEVDLTIDGATETVALGAVPATLAAAVTELESAIQSADPAAAFSDARVTQLGDQLCLLPGTAGAVTFAASAADTTTVSELQLVATYGVRARVSGAESIEELTVELPA